MISSICALSLALLAAAPEIPQAKDDRLQLQLVAAEPDVVTPTGLAVDRKGRVLVIESHTHFRPDGYQGPERDRILLMDQFGEDGKAGRIRVWFEGTTHTMNIAVKPGSDVVYVATRSEIFTLEDTDGDDKADKRTPICHLETKGNYPHNGLSGFAFRDSDFFFGFGENLGAAYTLVGSDGTRLSGDGDGGNVYQCRHDGSKLQKVATGFWNPFHLCLDKNGELFAVDNDPDARPPCRLLHVVQGADYGFRFRHGRRGTNPLIAWNGELPGILPMVAGTGEAPSGMIAIDDIGIRPGSDAIRDGFPFQLLVTSWGDHRIEGYQLKPQGASFTAEMTPLITGGEDFRPVGIAQGPDGTIYISDWVDKSYQLHGKGRIWRTVPNNKRQVLTQPPNQVARDLTAAVFQANPSTGRSLEEAKVNWNDPFVVTAIGAAIAKRLNADQQDWHSVRSEFERLGTPRAVVQKALLGQWSGGFVTGKDDWLRPLLTTADPEVRLAAVRVVAEYQMKQFQSEVERSLAEATTKLEFEVCVATLDLLGKNDNRANDWTGEVHAIRTVKAQTMKPEVRALALRVLRADHPELTVDFLQQCLADKSPLVRLEAIRTARQRTEPKLRDAIAAIAADLQADPRERAEAVLGLDGADAKARELLVQLTADESNSIAYEALRQLRGEELSEPEVAAIKKVAALRDKAYQELAALVVDREAKPQTPAANDLAQWMAHSNGEGDPEAGERIFFSSKSVGCWRCHEHEGRGALVGPALSSIGRSMSRERLVESILQPSKEIAPLYTPWLVQLDDGRSLTGMYVGEEVDGTLRLADNSGKIHRIHPRNIEAKKTGEESIMPAGLAQQLTEQEWRDLLAFLTKDGSVKSGSAK